MTEYSAFLRPLNQRICGVWFVLDYVQIQMDDYIVNLYCDIEAVSRSGRSYSQGELGWRDTLCEIIEATVAQIVIDMPKSLSIIASNGTCLKMHLQRGMQGAVESMSLHRFGTGGFIDEILVPPLDEAE